MEVAVVAVCVLVIVVIVTSLAVSRGNFKGDAARAIELQGRTSEEFDTYRKNTATLLANGRESIKELEAELDEVLKKLPGANRDRIVGLLGGVLPPSDPSEGDDDPKGVSGPGRGTAISASEGQPGRRPGEAPLDTEDKSVVRKLL